MTDRYTKTILTIIAGALVYLCIVMTPLPSAHAQGTARPGESSGPQEVVVVGWRPTTPLPVVAPQPLPVITQQGSNVADRVFIAGWEQVEGGRVVQRRVDPASQLAGVPVVVRGK